MDKVKHIIKEIFTLDLRSLAIMRIILGILVIINLIVICSNFEAFVSDYGIFPVSTALSRYPMFNYRGFHVISGSYRWQIPLFIIHFIVALSFICGYKTRISTIILWVFTCSLQGSQQLFLHGGDTVMRMLLFRSIFLPLGERYSIDTNKQVEHKQYIFSISSFALIIQVICIYLISVILKTDHCRTRDFTSVYYSLGIDYYTTDLGMLLRTHNEIMNYLSAFVYYLEWLGPIFYLIPYKKIKASICRLFILFHLGLAVFMQLGLFPRICICAWIGLLPQFSGKKDTTSSYYSSKNKEYIAAIFIIAVIIRNIHTIYPRFLGSTFPELQRYYHLTRLDQNRAMFAPSPSFSNGWHEFDGVYFSNSIVNLSNPDQKPYDYKPSHKDILHILPNSKRTRAGLTLNNNSFSNLRVNRAIYLCNKRNSTHDNADKIKSVHMKYHRQQTLESGAYGEIQTNDRGSRDCPRT